LRKTEQNGILVITDALFNVDSSSPDLVKLQSITEEYEAFLAINTGHDFGVMGTEGKGVW
jgi:7-keto-8-aminopelargonate synthetase-like enzyme